MCIRPRGSTNGLDPTPCGTFLCGEREEAFIQNPRSWFQFQRQLEVRGHEGNPEEGGLPTLWTLCCCVWLSTEWACSTYWNHCTGHTFLSVKNLCLCICFISFRKINHCGAQLCALILCPCHKRKTQPASVTTWIPHRGSLHVPNCTSRLWAELCQYLYTGKDT